MALVTAPMRTCPPRGATRPNLQPMPAQQLSSVFKDNPSTQRHQGAIRETLPATPPPPRPCAATTAAASPRVAAPDAHTHTHQHSARQYRRAGQYPPTLRALTGAAPRSRICHVASR